MNILGEIAEKTRERIKEEKRRLPLAQLKARIRAQDRTPGNGASGNSADRGGGSFSLPPGAGSPGDILYLRGEEGVPSRGVIAPEFPYLKIAREYEAAGAAAISCLTEPYYFRGSDEYLRENRAGGRIPVLRKDFTVDEYMIYQAKALGASAVLLICASWRMASCGNTGSWQRSWALTPWWRPMMRGRLSGRLRPGRGSWG